MPDNPHIEGGEFIGWVFCGVIVDENTSLYGTNRGVYTDIVNRLYPLYGVSEKGNKQLPDQEQDVPDEDGLMPGTVKAEKTASWVNYNERIGRIDFNVKGKAKKQGADVVIVLDKSGSMSASVSPGSSRQDERMIPAKEACIELINSLLGDPGDNNRVAVVPFSSRAVKSTHTDDSIPFQISATADVLTTAVNVTGAYGETAYADGLQKAREFINERNEDGTGGRPAYIIFISDGKATDGNNSDTIATQLKKQGVTIYSVGIQMGKGADEALKKLSGDSNPKNQYYQNVEEMSDLYPVLEKMAGNIKIAGTEGVIHDVISPYYDYYTDSSHISSGGVSVNGKNVTINVGNIIEMGSTYSVYVKLKDAYKNTKEIYKTNDTVKLDYIDVNDNPASKSKEEIGDPALNVDCGSIKILYYLSDEEGNYLGKNADGSFTKVPEKDKGFALVSEAYFKENGSGKLDIRTDGSTYSVIPEVPSGYTLYSGEPSSRSVTLTLDDTSKTVEFKVCIPKESAVSYRVEGPQPEHYEPALPPAHNEKKGSIVTIADGLTSRDTKDENGLVGVWTFNGWESDQVSATGRTFTMPGNDVEFVGTWKFTANTRTVEYRIIGEGPETFSPGVPPKASYSEGAVADLAEGLTSSIVTHNGLSGRWKFSGWTSEQVTPTDGKYIVPDQDVLFTGRWTFEVNKYTVSYSITGDGPDTSGYEMPESMDHEHGSRVTVADGFADQSGTNEDGWIGNWVFEGWKSDQVTPENGTFTMPGTSVAFTGSWRFEANEYKVSYKVEGEAPSGFEPTIPGTEDRAQGSLVTVGDRLEATVQRNKEGQLGTWSFQGWRSKDVDHSGGSFRMPGNDVEFTGSWIFTARTYDVSYIVESTENPAAFSAVPATRSWENGKKVPVQEGLTTKETTKDGLIGVWTFDGWRIDGVPVTDRMFTMPEQDVTFTGSWSFKPNERQVRYEVTGDAPKTFSPEIPGDTIYAEGSQVKVAADLESADRTDGNGLVGSWKFSGWKSAQVEPESGTFTVPGQDVVFTGSWAFAANERQVKYEVTGDAPETFSPGIPVITTHAEGSRVTVAPELKTTDHTNKEGLVGNWTFSGWTSSQVELEEGRFTVPQENVVFTGSWSFVANDRKVRYEVVGDAPETFSPEIPGDTVYAEGSHISMAENLGTTVHTDKDGLVGNWTFSGWISDQVEPEEGSFTVPGQDVVFTGSWSFVANERHVKYEVTGDAPETFSPQIPGDTVYAEGSHISVAENLGTTVNADKDGLVGNWTFSGWTSDQVEPEEGSFTVPGQDVVFTGKWTFTANERQVRYEVTGETPETFSPMIPGNKTYAEGSRISVAGNLETSVHTDKDELVGNWTFNGWSSSQVVLQEGSFTVPEQDVVFTGSWTFVTNERKVIYDVVGDAPETFNPKIPDSSSYAEGSRLNVAADLESTDTTDGNGLVGSWRFSGWKSDQVETESGSFTVPGQDVVFTGKWTFTANEHQVRYEVTGDTPKTFTPGIPGNMTYAEGSRINVAEALKTTEGTDGTGLAGGWQFNGWVTSQVNLEEGSFTVPDQDVVFTGSWTFVPNMFAVNYTVNGETPISFSPAIPDTKLSAEGSPVDIADVLTTKDTTNAQGLIGKWIFSGWGSEQVVPVNGRFAMPGNSVTFTGSWTFKPNEYSVSYSVTGEAPSAFKPSIPVSELMAEGSKVTMAGGLASTIDRNAAGQQGSWNFDGWGSSDVTLSDGSFIMPGKNVVFVGSWTFTPNNNSSGGSGGGSSSGGGSGNRYTPPSGGPGVTSDALTTINPEDVPLAQLPGVPVNLAMIDDGEIPLSGLPKTGDSFSKSTFTMIMASVLLVLASINKKRKENS